MLIATILNGTLKVKFSTSLINNRTTVPEVKLHRCFFESLIEHPQIDVWLTNIMVLQWHLAKIQIDLHIHAFWWESSLGTFWLAKDAKFLHADNEDSDQTATVYNFSLH